MKKNNLKNIPSRNPISAKYLLTAAAITFAGSVMAQNAQPAQAGNSSLSLFANPLFNVLLGIVLLLMITIIILGGVLKNVAEATKDKNKTSGGNIVGVIALLIFLSSGKSMFAQEVIAPAASTGFMGLNSGLFYFLLVVIGFEILIISVLMSSIKLFIKEEKQVIAQAKAEPSLLEKLNASVAIENEQDIMFDHSYDGIRELDNDLPPWWKFGFYFTIGVAVIYLVNYHVIKTGDLQIAEYNKSVEEGRIAKEEYQKMNANNVNESNVTMLADKAEIEKGGTIFKENCSVCHGKSAEGGVGPNLTDDYWLHGGSIADVFKTIKYGWPDKGMKSWQADLTPVQIHEIASYIKTLKGSNPANPKAPQGDLFTEGPAAKSDSTKTDSTAVSVKADSVKVAVK